VLIFKAAKTPSPQSIHFLILNPVDVLFILTPYSSSFLSSPPAPLLGKERGGQQGRRKVVFINLRETVKN